MKILANKTITDVPGYLASGIACGIKKDGKKDLCVVFSKYDAVAAAVFTTNKVKGAPLFLSMENIGNASTRAIVVNSGNANSLTGEEGTKNAVRMLEETAQCLKISPGEVLVQSTGALAVQLPMDIVIPGIHKVCSQLSEQGGKDAAEAILTTDTEVKTVAVEFEIEGKKVTMAGMAKGSTMIHPNMATMLAVIATNAGISKKLLEKAFTASVGNSYNMISVDGDTSTNDMAVIFANGEAGHGRIDSENEGYEAFCEALEVVNMELARMIAADGEGSSKLLEIQVIHARSVEDAKKCARSIAASTLVKCAIFGSHPGFPDIACAMGYSGAEFNPGAFDIYLVKDGARLQLMKNAVGSSFDEALAKSILLNERITILVDLKDGIGNAVAWGCDMNLEYVKANAYL